MLLILSGAATLALVIASENGAFTFLPAYGVFIFSTLAVSSSLQLAERKSIANFRRVSATLFAGAMFWVVCVAAGLVFSLFGFQRAVGNSVVFGAFAAAAIQFLIINGAFSKKSALSLALAAVYPLATFLLLSTAGPGLAPVIGGGAAFVVVASFTVILGRKRTSLGYDALGLFRAFMKTWVAGEADDLEAIIADHSEDVTITTKVLRFNTSLGDYFIVLPGVHPGPFHPVGSYDLPGEVSRAFEGLGRTLTLHRPGGHERNLATSTMTVEFARKVAEFAKGVEVGPSGGTMRGPLSGRVGKASVGSVAFGRDGLATISFAPLGSDDLSAETEEVLGTVGAKAGLDLSVVDAHNSIDDQQESPDLDSPEWALLFEALAKEAQKPMRVGYSHSSELGFTAGDDVTENGVSLLLFSAGSSKHVLVLADANNAVPTLREKVADALAGAGYSLMEVCTSDSHNLAARGMTVQRGYKALGEETPMESITDLIVRMARLADTRLGDAAYGSGRLTSEVRVFGSKALEEFAGITQSSSNLGAMYFRLATASTAVLLLLSLLF